MSLKNTFQVSFSTVHRKIAVSLSTKLHVHFLDTFLFILHASALFNNIL